MYSIILVDDERSLRESIANLVDWAGNGFELIGTAENGLDALELMENGRIPDVVVTDIRMPIMDGIELAKRLREEYPTIKIIFLSGYDEFQYAVAGIELNVVSYLLKPISRNEFEECLSDLRDQLDEEIKSVSDLSRVSTDYNKNIEMMKVSFLNSLLTEHHFEAPGNTLSEFLATHDLEFLNDEKILFTVRFDARYSPETEKQKNTEYLRFSLYRIVQNVVKKYVKSEVFPFSSYIICVLTGTPAQLNELKDIIAKDLLETTKKLLRENIVIGVSENYTDIYQTRKAYQDTLSALDYTRADDENVVFIGDIEKTSARPKFLYEIDEGALLLALKTNDHEFLKEIFETFFDEEFYDSHNRMVILRTVISIIYVNCMRALRETTGQVDEFFNQQYQQIFDSIPYKDLNEIRKELYDFCLLTMEEINRSRSQLKNTLVVEGLEYLEANFDDNQLSLKSISQYLNVTPSYFSTIFKKETGKSFIDTLTELRMKKAKELVLTTDYKIYEIASECGYDDQHYFSYSFKKYFGVSPTKMREKEMVK